MNFPSPSYTLPPYQAASTIVPKSSLKHAYKFTVDENVIGCQTEEEVGTLPKVCPEGLTREKLSWKPSSFWGWNYIISSGHINRDSCWYAMFFFLQKETMVHIVSKFATFIPTYRSSGRNMEVQGQDALTSRHCLKEKWKGGRKKGKNVCGLWYRR